jgi:exosortase C (VPDSG-CTERM-specific)
LFTHSGQRNRELLPVQSVVFMSIESAFTREHAMNKTLPTIADPTPPTDTITPPAPIPTALPLALGALAICFSVALYRQVTFALQSDLFSYTLLVPLVSGYLLWGVLKLRGQQSDPVHRGIPASLALGGAVALLAAWGLGKSLTGPTAQDGVALVTLSFVSFFAAIWSWFLDAATVRRSAFALAFLLFMAPLPIAIEAGLEMFLQHGSAPVAHWLFLLAQTTVHKYDLTFELPGIALRVAPECSGIRSTLVLFLTSLVAGHLFLRSTWRHSLLVAAVVPLALARNGLRIFAIGELCVRIGPHMIDSDFHHKGGSIFFALSLVPFFALVYLLVKSERRSLPRHAAPAPKDHHAQP